MINEIIKTGQKVQNNRTIQDVMIKLTEEIGEVASVVSVISGHTNYKEQQEALSGEIADVIIAVVDLGRLHYGADFENILKDKISKKLKKWEDKYNGR